MRVLVVDDDEALLETLEDILALEGFDVLTAQRGRPALDMLLTDPTPPLVALVDLGLPDISGLDLAAELRDRGSSTQVVILTGDSSLDSVIRAVRADTVDYLVKPVQPPRLLETIGRASDRGLRKQAEAELEHERKRRSDILEASPVGIAVLTVGGEVTYLNKAATSILGVNGDGSVRSAANGSPAPPLASGRAARWLAACVREGRTEAGFHTGSVDRSYTRADGRTFTLSCRLSPLEAPDGSLDGVLHVFTDITERQQLEEGLREAQKMEAVGRLAGGVSHDFNNLLTVILGHSELMLADLPESSHHRQDVQVIREASRQASEVARQLLTFSRRNVGRAERVDLNELIRGTSGLLSRTIGSGTDVREELDPSVPAVEADPGWMRQVILNLAINARDAMDPDGGVLTFRTGCLRGEELDATPLQSLGGGAAWIHMDVEDNGHGMDEATRSRVFEPFFTTKEEGQGTGLGLATVYGIITQLGGVIDVESEPGLGSRFRIWLPASAEAAVDVEPTPDEPQVTGRRGCTVLVVDDQADIRTLLRRILVREGHVVLEASHGREAIDVARHHGGRIDLIVTDYNMPGIPPAEFLPTLLRRDPEARVVVVTGSIDPGSLLDDIAGRTEGRMVRKPFTAEQIRRAMREVLG